MAKVQPTITFAVRIEAALKEGRSAQALQLAKQNALQSPGGDSQSLLRRCYLVVIEQHVSRDAFRDAHSVLSEAEKLPFEDPEWWLRLAELRANLGDHAQAMKLLDKVPDPMAKNKILAHIADRAMREPGDTGKTLLSLDLHGPFNLIRKAFDEYDQGRDDVARELLNGIGMTSPFLEWKLMLRGLMAWSANNDVKAQENWGRLTANRLPAKLVAPLRFATDRAFVALQSPDRAAILQRQSESLGTGMSESLRRLRKQLATDHALPQAFETARTLVPELKKTAPHLVSRIANVFYWSIVQGGQPEDLNRFSKTFGPHPDDPQNFRLQALVMEVIGHPNDAHGWWAKYEEWIARNPERWPGAQAAYARAMILERMGNLANDWLEMEGDDEPDELLDFFDIMSRARPARAPRKKTPLTPTPQECFQRASQLAPQWLAPSLRLLQAYAHAKDFAKAKATTDDLLTRFPKNLHVLEAAAKVYDEIEDIEKSRACLKQALSINPLDRKLQQRVALVALNHARRRALANECADARTALAEAKQYGDATLAPALLALAFAVEARAGALDVAQPLANELFKLPGMRVAGAYRLMVEMSRVKCPKKSYTVYSTTFTDGLKSLTQDELLALLTALDLYKQEATPYFGMKTHEKKILDCLTRVMRTATTLDEVVGYGFILHRYKMWKALQDLARNEIARQDAHLIFFEAEATLSRRRDTLITWRIGQQYKRVWDIIQAARDNRYARLKELFDQRRQQSPELDEAMSERSGWYW